MTPTPIPTATYSQCSAGSSPAINYPGLCCQNGYPYYWTSDGMCHTVAWTAPTPTPTYSYCSTGYAPAVNDQTKCCLIGYPYYWSSDNLCHTVAPSGSSGGGTSDTEEVSILKVWDFDKYFILRDNGQTYLIWGLIGCFLLLPGDTVLIHSPGLFAGIGSELIIPDEDEECNIWNSEYIGIYPTFIESKIDGEFEGWDGDTIFQLTNGQVWQQSSYNYHYHYAYRPDVLIYSTGSGYKMMVEGVDRTISVIRLY